jgi:predicted  nucleic acid-binding Zn-ribbon protein
MWFRLFAWMLLLGASAVFAKGILGLDPGNLFSALPASQRLAAGAIVFAALALIGSAIWQAYKLARQDKDLRLLRARFKGIRQDTVVGHVSQANFDTAVQNLFDSDPEETISSLQKKLADTEQRATLQQGQNEAVDMQARVDDIRRRQQALRETIGGVAEKRRAIEPVFSELRDRQRQLERSLTELEVDDGKNHLAVRLKELDDDVSLILTRLNVLQESMATLNRFKEEMGKSQAELVPLRAPEAGINALIDELRLRRDQLNITLDELESNGDDKLSLRVEALSKGKLEVEQKVARLDEGFNILNAIRLDFEELGERRAHLERSLAEIETDSNGRSLADRQNALNEFVIQSRLRLRTLQDSLATLNQFKEELAKSKAEIVPLQAPVFGIEALIGEVHASRDHITETLDEIELSGDEELGSRVEALSKSKFEIDGRIAKVFEHFTTLDSIRKDIGGIFTTIRNTLNRIG